MTATTCYTISAGSYSDYRVLAVFTTKEMAEQQLLRYYESPYEPPFIEELPLDPIVPAPPVGMVGYSCHEDDRRRIYANRESDLDMSSDENLAIVGKVSKSDCSWRGYSVLIWARDEEHAIKIAAEKFAHQRAIDAGIA